MTAKVYWKSVWIIGVVFFVLNGLYLHRVPGLMGDEASEGQNVYELLTREEGITVVGERSYIGPLIDYIRVPFVGLFGYSAWSLRVVMLLLSVITLGMAASVFRRWFGDQVALFPLVFMSFSLPYLTYQRLGWAITLFPFFFFLTVWLAQRSWQFKWLWVGLAAGIGLHTHVMFLPTVVAMAVVAFGFLILSAPRLRQSADDGWRTVWHLWFDNWNLPAQRNRFWEEIFVGLRKLLGIGLVLLVGFWAGFGTQFVVLQMFTDDQGDTSAVAGLMSERWRDLSQLMPLILSGSSFVARYTGVEFAPMLTNFIMWLVLGLGGLALILVWRNKYIWLWAAGLGVHLAVLLYMIDRFTLRYFVVFVLGMYVLAGVGMGEIVRRVAGLVEPWVGKKMITKLILVKAIGLAIVLGGVWMGAVLMPFLRTGGSVDDFSLGNRTNSASALVDVRPLLECVRGRVAVGSENVHIYNRLLYLSHAYTDIDLVPEDEVTRARYLVHYRDQQTKSEKKFDEACPELEFFVVEKKID